jgi:hypothetical protein
MPDTQDPAAVLHDNHRSRDDNPQPAPPIGGSETPSDLGVGAVASISAGLNALLADMFALYMKTKNFHWHMSGPNFRDFHLLLDDQADKITRRQTSSLSACARSARRRFVPSETSHAGRDCRIATRTE